MSELETATIGLPLVLIADAAQNGMAGSYTSVTDGLILVAVIVFWAFFLDWLSYHVRWFERLTKARRILIVHDGHLLSHNLRKELITEEELWSQLRLQGVEELAQVRSAFVEADGRISVIQEDGAR